MVSTATKTRTGFHGWKVLGLCTFAQFVAMGFTLYLLGVFIEPLATTFMATQGQIGSASAVFAVSGALMSPLLGYFADKDHTRRLLLLGAVFMSVGFILLSQAQSLLQASLCCMLLLAPGAALLGTIPTTVMVAHWFTRRRGLAIGVTAAGISMGGLFMPPIAAVLLEDFGPRLSLLILGGLIAGILLPTVWWLAVVKPADIGQYPDGNPDNAGVMDQAEGQPLILKALFARRDFWTIAISAGVMSFAGILILTYLAPFAQASGMSLQQSALMVSLYSFSGIAGKFTTGWLSDNFAPRRILTLTLVVSMIGWLPMLNIEGMLAFAITACSVGFAMGGLIPVWSSLIALNFGLNNFGRVRGIMSVALIVFTIIPGPLAGYLYDTTGSYVSSFSILWWALPVGVFASLFVPKAAEPVNQAES